MKPAATRNRARKAVGAREKLLVVGAIVVGIAGAYLLTRVKAREDELKLFSEEIQRLRAESGTAKGPRGTGRDLDDANEALAAAKAMLAGTLKALAEQTRDQVNARSSEAVESVMQALAEAASLHRVQVLQAEPFSAAVAGMPGVAASAPAGPAATPPSPLAGRPMRRLVLVGTYASLSAFLEEAQRLRQSVRVLSLSMRVADTTAGGTQSPRLQAELVVLL